MVAEERTAGKGKVVIYLGTREGVVRWMNQGLGDSKMTESKGADCGK